MIHEHGNVFDVIIVDKTLNRNTRLGRLAFTARTILYLKKRGEIPVRYKNINQLIVCCFGHN